MLHRLLKQCAQLHRKQPEPQHNLGGHGAYLWLDIDRHGIEVYQVQIKYY